MNLTLVAKENTPMAFQGLEDQIRHALEGHGPELTMEALAQDLKTGENQLWICAIELQIYGWAITAIARYDGVRRLRFLLLGGFDMQTWLKHIEEIEQWALREMKVDEAEAWVRPGLRKKLEVFGYAKTYEVVTKRIERRATN